jgi:hypothetical protein
VKQTKTKNHTVERGLFLVRYEAAADTVSPPTVTVSSETAGEHQVAVITDPDVIYGVLSRPGDCLVLKALQRGVVRIEVAPQSERGSTDATVQVERLRNGKPPQDEVSHQVKRPDRVKQVSRAGLSDEDELPSDGLEIIGHVARRGDVSIKAGEWLAGPGAPSQIEGVSFFWPGKPDAVTLTYSVEMGGRGVRPTQSSAKLGQFAGTKGRAAPLLGLTLALEGAGASGYELVAEGLFLGSAPVRSRGETVSLKSPTGREPLVGLKVDIERKVAMRRGASRERASFSSSNSGVRVFRGQDQTTAC